MDSFLAYLAIMVADTKREKRRVTIGLKPEDGAGICQPSALTPLSKTTSHGW